MAIDDIIRHWFEVKILILESDPVHNSILDIGSLNFVILWYHDDQGTAWWGTWSYGSLLH